MDDLLTRQNIAVQADQDRVTLRIGRLDVPMPYAASFKIAQGLRLAAKEAMRMCGEDNKDWREQSRLDYYPDPVPVSPEKRITLPPKFAWSVAFDGEMVIFRAGNNEARFHFTVALKLAEWLRAQGARCKA